MKNGPKRCNSAIYRDGSMTRGGEINDVGDECLAEKGYVATRGQNGGKTTGTGCRGRGAPAHN